MKKATIRIENIKKFDSEIQTIFQIESLNSSKIELAKNPVTIATLSKDKTEFILHTNERELVFEEIDKTKNLSIKIHNDNYIITKCQFSSSSTDIKVNSSVKLSSSYSVHSLKSKSFKEKSIFKAFFPVDLSEIKTFHNEFETITYQRNDIEYFYDCIRIVVNRKQFDITQIKTENQGFYVIENFNEETLDDFNDYCFSIRLGLGFINKLVVGSEEYIFSSNKDFYYSNYIRPSIKAMYKPVETNPFSILDIESNIAKNYFGLLTRVSPDILSNLISKIKNNEELSSVIILLLESTSVRSLLIIPSIFSVVIESLSRIISKQETGLIYPIADKKLKLKVIEELSAVIDSNSSTLDRQSILKIKRRIQEINRPINKEHLTNNEKLTLPFEQLGINLTIEDISIIEHRNDLLHGNILMTKDVENSKNETNNYLAYVSARLYTLISKLILKYVGYEGYVYNQSKYLEKHLRLNTNSEYFEKI